MRKRNKGKHFSSFKESSFEAVNLPFTVGSLAEILTDAVSVAPQYTHQQISNWAWRFWRECDEGSLVEIAETDPVLAVASEIAIDIDAQWDMFLLNTYSMEQLQDLDFSKIELPKQWFVDWLKKPC